jgi:hypothetical protein
MSQGLYLLINLNSTRTLWDFPTMLESEVSPPGIEHNAQRDNYLTRASVEVFHALERYGEGIPEASTLRAVRCGRSDAEERLYPIGVFRRKGTR